MNEEVILRDIAKRFGRRSRGVKVGVGDDAALVRIGRSDVVMTTDAVVEGVDFDLRYFGWADVGYKALSAAVSDLYACGAVPAAFLVTAGIPRGTTRSQVRALLAGLSSAAAGNRATIVGGDLTCAPKLFLDVCAVGKLLGNFKSRSGARPGDFVFLSGEVGSSRAALLCLRQKKRPAPALLKAHLRPPPPRSAGLRLGRASSVTAMMDVSDGLLIDLERMCSAGRVAAGICPSQIPIHPAAIAAFRGLGKNAQKEAMQGGEDYVLLFTVRPPVPSEISSRYFCIGRILGKARAVGHIYNMERRPPARIGVKGFLHRF